jgi:hypothetical protein
MSQFTLCVVLLLVSAQHISAQDAPSNRLLPLNRALTPFTFDMTGAATNGLRVGQIQQPIGQNQQPNSPRRSGWKWGMGIGAAAGFTGGMFQPEPLRFYGDYVLGSSSRVGSAAALAGIGAGVGAAIGWAIDRARN